MCSPRNLGQAPCLCPCPHIHLQVHSLPICNCGTDCKKPGGAMLCSRQRTSGHSVSPQQEKPLYQCTSLLAAHINAILQLNTMALLARSSVPFARGGDTRKPCPLPRGNPSPWSLPRPGRLQVIMQSSAAAEQGKRVTPAMPYVREDSPASGECTTSVVTVDNSGGHMTRLQLESPDFPGLLRTVTWVLHGMGLRVQNASLRIKDKVAHNNFWLTTWTGKKLNDEQACLMQERVSDFVVYCEPRCTQRMEWQCRNLCVSNSAHPDYTQLVIEGEPKRQGFLLEMASVLDGTGARVQEAYIQSRPVAQEISAAGGTPVPELADVAPAGYDFSNGRYFKFLLSDASGAKLDASRIGALLFSYDVFTDARHMPLIAPNMDTYLKQVEQGCL